MQTFYDALNVPMSASQGELRHAYRRLLVRVHPDRCYHDNESAVYNTTAELDAARLALLDKAYRVLSNPQERARYDAYLARQLWGGSCASAYHRPPPRLARPLSTLPATPVLHVPGCEYAGGGGARVFGADGEASVLHAVKALPSEASGGTGITMESRKPHPSAAAAAAAAKEGGKVQDVLETHGRSGYANPMTCAIGVPGAAHAATAAAGAAAEGRFARPVPGDVNAAFAAEAALPTVYTAAVMMQRRPDGTVSVRAIKSSPRAVRPAVDPTTTGSAASPTPDVSATSTTTSPVSAAAPAELPAQMPTRLRVIEQHLVTRA